MHNRHIKGLTLIEAMISLTIVAVASLGALSYQYHGAGQFRHARAEIAATQIGQLLIQDWKSTGGEDSYRIGGANNHNPVSLDIGFVGSNGNYQINREVLDSDGGTVLDTMTFYCTLTGPMTIETDSLGFAGDLVQITVTVRWRNMGSGTPDISDPSLTFATYVRSQD